MKRAEPGWFVLALAGLAAILGSFLPFYTYTGDVSATVWNRGLFPTATLIPLLGFAIGVEALFVLIRGREPRSPFLNFTWEQVRLAVGAFMILLALSYVVQDRAGGTLAIGYLVLSLSALATFAGGVMTRRAELARPPGEEAPEREARPLFRPAVATVNRVGSELGKNVAGFGHNVRSRLRERSETKGAANVAREKAAAAAAAAATKAKADAKVKAEVEQKADVEAKDAAAPVEAPEAPAMQPPPPTETFDVPAAELPTATEKADVPPAEPPPTAEDPAEEPTAKKPAEELPADEPSAEEVARAITEPAVEDVEEPTVQKPVGEPTDDMLVEEAPVEDASTKVAEEPAVDEPATKPIPAVEETAANDAKEAEKTARVAPLSAVAPETDPDDTPTPDGKTSQSGDDSEKTVESKPTGAGKTSAERKPPNPAPAEEVGETEKERADTGTES
jgi:hypothetical protein